MNSELKPGQQLINGYNEVYTVKSISPNRPYPLACIGPRGQLSIFTIEGCFFYKGPKSKHDLKPYISDFEMLDLRSITKTPPKTTDNAGLLTVADIPNR